MASETCGWLIKGYKGKPDRPCARKLNHKDVHRDVEYFAQLKIRQFKNREANRERHRNYTRTWRINNPQKVAASNEVQRIKKLNRFEPTKDGFAYVLVSKWRPGIVKIGSTRDLKQNLYNAKRYLPDANHVRAYPGGPWLELRYLHRVFKDFVEPSDKIRHEWFSVPPEAVDLAVLLLHILLQYPAFLMSKELL